MKSLGDKVFLSVMFVISALLFIYALNNNYTVTLYENDKLTCEQVKNSFLEGRANIYEYYLNKSLDWVKNNDGSAFPDYKTLNDYQIENNYTFKCKKFIEEERKEICELQSFWMLDSIKKNSHLNVKYPELCKYEIENLSSTVDKLEFQFETINGNKFVVFEDKYTLKPEYLNLRDVGTSSIKQIKTIFGERYRFCLTDKNNNNLKACVYRVNFDDIMKYFDDIMGEIEKEIDKEKQIKSLN